MKVNNDIFKNQNIKSRDRRLDILRVLACISVVITHTCSYLSNTNEYYSFIWNLCTWISSLNMFAVPIFFMISGYFLLEKNIDPINFYIKSFKKVILPFIFWSFIYYLYSKQIWIIFTQNNMPIFKYNEFFTSILTGEPHMWFVFYLISFYLFLPFFKYLTLNTSLLILYFKIVLILKFILPYLTFIQPLSPLSNVGNMIGVSNFFGFSVYFLLGYCITTSKKLTSILKKYSVCIFWLSIMIIPILTTISSFYGHEKNFVFQNYLSPSILLASASLFYIFINLKEIKNPILIYISKLHKYTYTVYLSHVLIINLIIFAGFYEYISNIYLALFMHIVLSILFSFIVSVICEKIINILLKKKGVAK